MSTKTHNVISTFQKHFQPILLCASKDTDKVQQQKLHFLRLLAKTCYKTAKTCNGFHLTFEWYQDIMYKYISYMIAVLHCIECMVMYTFIVRSRHLKKTWQRNWSLTSVHCIWTINMNVTCILSIHEVMAMALSKTNKEHL